MAMLKFLALRECGLDPPWLLPRVYQYHRYTQIKLSACKEFSRCHKSGVTSIDIDRQAGRYVLTGGRDKHGYIGIHDICPTTAARGDITGEGKNSPYPIVAKTMSSSSSLSRRTSYQPISHAISVVQWYPHDTGVFTSSSVDKTLRIWDTNQMMVVEKFSFSRLVYTHAMAVAESHSLIAVGDGESKVTLCDIASGSITHTLRAHSKSVMALAWSPISDHLLASAGEDNTLLLWDVRKASGPLMSLDHHNGSGSSSTSSVVSAHNGCVNGLCFTSDGLYIVSFGTDDALRLWNSYTGKNTLLNYGRIPNTLIQQTVQLYCTPHTNSLQPLAVVPSGGELVMVELMTGKKVKKLCGHFGNVNCVIGHPLEQEFYSGGTDRNILAWSPPSPDSEVSVGRHGHTTPHSRVMGVYGDAWSSSDED